MVRSAPISVPLSFLLVTLAAVLLRPDPPAPPLVGAEPGTAVAQTAVVAPGAPEAIDGPQLAHSEARMGP